MVVSVHWIGKSVDIRASLIFQGPLIRLTGVKLSGLMTATSPNLPISLSKKKQEIQKIHKNMVVRLVLFFF